MTTQPTGLREQKKQQTRQAISDIATRLFMERGFDAVTIADIAVAARVAKMTVTNYFPRKEDLALDLQEEFTGFLARTVADRGVGESALAALRRAYLNAVDQRDPLTGFTGRAFVRMIVASPALTSRLREFHDLREQALADLLTTETQAAPDDITPRAAAAQLAGAHRVLFMEANRRTLAGDGPDLLAEALVRAGNQTFDLLTPALAGYAVRR